MEKRDILIVERFIQYLNKEDRNYSTEMKINNPQTVRVELVEKSIETWKEFLKEHNLKDITKESLRKFLKIDINKLFPEETRLNKLHVKTDEIEKFVIISNTLKEFPPKKQLRSVVKNSIAWYFGYCKWELLLSDCANGKFDKSYPLVKSNIEIKKDSYRNKHPLSIYLLDNNNENVHEKIGFIGREFLFEFVNSNIRNDLGYNLIIGDAGIGKSSFARKLASDKNYFLHTIKSGGKGDNSFKRFIQNISAHLIIEYNLNYANFDEGYKEDGIFLEKILKEVSQNLKVGDQKIIVVDGIDELRDEDLTKFRNENILFLPNELPSNIFFILTMRDIRKKVGIPDSVDKENEFVIEADGKLNKEDASKYIKERIKEEGVQSFLKQNSLTEEDLITELNNKSGGNFMYLKHVIDELAKKNSMFSDLKLSGLPDGLEKYYKWHFEKMKAVTNETLRTKLKVIYVICESSQPISAEFISSVLKTDDVVEELLDEWEQFLRVTKKKRVLYEIYHESFREFLMKKETCKILEVQRDEIKALIVDDLKKKSKNWLL